MKNLVLNNSATSANKRVPKLLKKLAEQSPIFSLEKIDCPLIVIQGGRDPRVVQSESDQIVEKLKKDE